MSRLMVESAVASRALREQRVDADLVVVGGGLAGTCCAITAARAGARVALVQDRPVLGGNASSEVRLWALGATSHMANNNRWAREGGVIDEILVENWWRNPEGNAAIFDTVLLEKVHEEANITLLLDTAVFEVGKDGDDRIASVRGFNAQSATMVELRAPLFSDASGDGIVGFLAGAPFRMGAESAEDFGELMAPGEAYGNLLGHTIYFMTKDAGRPVAFHAPSYALKDITAIPRFGHFTTETHGPNLWWLEYGGRGDTVHDTAEIKWELWKVVYGVWDYIKNSGRFPEAATLTLEWVGLIPGKRESRRFEGDAMLTQADIVEQRQHDDAVAFGGWSIDLHPADGVYSELPGCWQLHSKGVYGIPYRCLYSRTIRNVFLAGRIISASHVAFGSTRVMCTCAHAAQAVGMAAALCARDKLLPADLAQPERVRVLQRALLRTGQHIPGVAVEDPDDVARVATVTASSRLVLAEMPDDGPTVRLERDWAQMLPGQPGRAPAVTFTVDADAPTELELQLRVSSKADNHTPDVTMVSRRVALRAGAGQSVVADFDVAVPGEQYLFYCLMANEHVSVHTSEMRVTGVLSVYHAKDQAGVRQYGVEEFEFWRPERRPGGRNLAMRIAPALDAWGPANVVNGWGRPTCRPNAWVADPGDANPTLTLTWDAPVTVGRIELGFDTDFDFPAETAFWGHTERVSPFCARQVRLTDGQGRLLGACVENHQSRVTMPLSEAKAQREIRIGVLNMCGGVPGTVLSVAAG